MTEASLPTKAMQWELISKQQQKQNLHSSGLLSFDVSSAFPEVKSSSLGHHALKILNSVYNHYTLDNQA